jgi:SAM-dependent methyltransferase
VRVPRYEHPVFAAQYDLSEGDASHLGDREWYARRVASARKRGIDGVTLEIGAGTGRVTRTLVAAGADRDGVDDGAADRARPLAAPLVALDVGLPMLQRLRVVAPRAHPLCGDMTRLPLAGGSAAVAYAAYNVLGCLLEPRDLAACAAELARVVAPGGRLLLDVAVHHATDHPPGPRRLDWESWRTPEGLEIRRRMTIEHDAPRRRLHLDYVYAWRGTGGAEERREVAFALNTWPPETYLEALGTAGFRIETTHERTFEGRSGKTRMWIFVEAARP